MKHFCLVAIIALVAAGCVGTKPASHGIPNFGISGGVAHGGQPTAAGWNYLRSTGFTNDVKLNTVSESEDETNGLQLTYFPINLEQQITGEGVSDAILSAEERITAGTFVHCEHGKNRTMTLIGFHLIKHGWTKASAQKEMDSYGWEDSLPGLKEFWRNTR